MFSLWFLIDWFLWKKVFLRSNVFGAFNKRYNDSLALDQKLITKLISCQNNVVLVLLLVTCKIDIPTYGFYSLNHYLTEVQLILADNID